MLSTSPDPIVTARSPRKGSPLCGLCAALCMFSFSTPSFAQAVSALENLLFDPVLLEVQELEDGYEARELTQVPQGDPTDLASWLASRQASGPGSAADTPEADIERYQRVIAESELAGGPYATDLSESLMSLGMAYRRAGDHGQALSILERASHINRVNHGLFNLEQIPIIEQTIETHLARGDLIAADAQHEYLFYLQRKNHGDRSIDLLPALIRYAEWNIFAFNARLMYTPPAITTDGSAASVAPVAITDTNMEMFRTKRLVNAQNIYRSIVQILRNNYGSSDPRLLEAEKQLALTNYFFANAFAMNSYNPDFASALSLGSSPMPYDMGPIASGSLGYREGLEALERRVNYLRENATPTELARARTDLGDWLLIFKKRMGAIEVYDEAFMSLQSSGLPQAEVDAVFHPPLPQAVPGFLTHNYTRAALNIPADMALEYKGYVDVEYSLNRFGLPSGIEVLGSSGEASEAVEARLLRHLRRSQFRPRYVGGAIPDGEVVHARYYFTY